jgi:hypothetical protein
MANTSNAALLSVSTILFALPLAPSPLGAAEGGTGPQKPAVKGGQKGNNSRAQQSNGASSGGNAAVVSESGGASNLVRAGLSVSLVNSIEVSDLRQFSKMVESQRESDGLASVMESLKKCNASGEEGALFISNVANLVRSGSSLGTLVDFSRSMGQGELSVSEAGRFLGAVAEMEPEDSKRLLQSLGEELRKGDKDALKLVKTTAEEAGGGAGGGLSFRIGLTEAALKVYDNLTVVQKAEFRRLFTMPLYQIGSEKVSELLQNTVLMEQFIALMESESGKSMSNPLLQEAAVVGNQILRDIRKSASFSLSSADAFTYDKLLPNGYNKALAVLIAKYSNNEAIANTVNTFVDSKSRISGATLLNEIFTESGENTDLLGLRKLSYIKPTSGNLNYAISQGEAWIARNFSFGADSGLTIDLTDTNLSQAQTSNADRLGAGGGPEGARLFAITALGNMSLNGRITLQHQSVNASMTRNVVSLGALNTLTIADNTHIFNQGRALALGAGKLQGPNGAPVYGLSLRSEGSIAIGSGKSLFLEDASFTIGQSNPKLLMYAENTISLSNPRFDGFGALSDFYFEAITINLSNVSLPDDVFIRLVSRDGGTANGSTGYGYYPHFGAPAVGRVNFLGVRVGTNPINNTSDFDAFGGNIRIGKIGAASGPLGYGLEDSRAAFNTVLMEKFPALIQEAAALSLSNPMLQEAGTVGNQILKDVRFDGSVSLSSREAFTYDKLFPNGYNKALVALIAKYSGSERLVNGVSELVAEKSTINDSTTLSSIFTEKNTDLLGLRKQSYFNLDPLNPVTTLSQGESYLARAITVSSDSGVTLDVTDTKLKESGNTKQTSRLYTVAALGDMSVSGKITVKNSNPNAEKTRNVVAIGAVNSLKVADRTEIINQGRVLAVGAGKLQGTNGETITGLKLESKGAIAVGSGKNMNLVDATFTMGGSKSHLVMFAQNEMSVTNPSFNNFGSKSEIYMEATTVNLTNVNFPGGSNVRLRSRDGGTQDGTAGEGIYPKFGASAPGRVNFISNVRYDGSLIGTTEQFNAHKENISIRKIGPAN